MKPIVIGADGTLGRFCLKVLEENRISHAATTLFEDPGLPKAFRLDLLKPETWRIPEGTDTAFLLAAEPSLERCRRNPKATAAINVEGTIALLEWLSDRGVFTVFPSTNLVFDGKTPRVSADAPLCPITVYGHQKSLVESAIRKKGFACAVARLTKVLSTPFPLVARWSADLKHGRTIRPFKDMVLSPIPLSGVCRMLVDIAGSRNDGIWQLSGDRDISYADLAAYLAKKNGADMDLVRPVLAEVSGADIEHLPVHTTLDDARVRAVFGGGMPGVWDTVDAVLSPLTENG